MSLDTATRRSRAGVLVMAAALSPAWLWVAEGRAQDDDARYEHAALEQRRPAQLASAPEPDDPFLEEGRRIYLHYCASCHGDTGAGDGLGGAYMRPPPRDFTSGNYALRTTRSGELPTDADLFRVISRGIPGTAMPAWGEGIFTLSELERWQVVYFVKTLSEIFWDEYTNPYRSVEGDEPPPILMVGEPPPRTDELLARGRELYLDQEAGGCARCHGAEGRGDGDAIDEMFDDMGRPARPYDLTNPWRNKGGSSVRDIYRTLSSGLSGTPMPDFMDGIPDDRDRWALAYYAHDLIEARTITDGTLFVRRIDGALPDGPDDDAWESCDPFGVAMMGQFAVAPRWQAPTIDYVRVCAFHDEREIVIRLEWNDPFMDNGDEDADGADAAPQTTEGESPDDGAPAASRGPTYIAVAAMDARARAESIPDRLVLQMPAGRRAANEAQRPHMFMGDETHPVHVFTWSARDGGTIGEGNANGDAEDYAAQDPGAVQVTGRSVWHGGRWRVVFRRALATDELERDAQLEPSGLLPFNLRVWDGSAGERGLQSATSSWHHLYLEMPTPMAAYGRGVATMLLGYLLVGLVWWRVGKRQPRGSRGSQGE